jgi:hypothetical protein
MYTHIYAYMHIYVYLHIYVYIRIYTHIHNETYIQPLTHTHTTPPLTHRWQNALVKCQHAITEQKSYYLKMRVEMFEKVSTRVDTRLNAFVEDIKVMQKTLKKDLGDSMSTERDLRRLLETDEGKSV